MAYPVEKVLTDLRNAADFADFSKIARYIEDHETDYGSEDYSILTDNVEEIRERHFNPTECSQVRNIYYIMKSGLLSREYSAMGLNRAMSLCSEAHDFNEPLYEYIYDLYPDLLSFKVEVARPTEYQRTLARELLPTMEKRYRGVAIPEKKATAGEVEVGINLPELFERQKRDLQELIEAAQSENTAEIQRLRDEINRLQSRIESKEPSPHKEITRVLDTEQYRYFSANAYKLNLPTTQSRIARGQYQVRITVENQAQENAAQGFMAEAEKHERPLATGERIRPPGFDQVLDILCRNYTKASGMSCGLSRTGALSTLAERLIEYAISQGTEWDKMFDINSLDLFAKRGRIYTREQADEGFNNAISGLQGSALAGRMAEATEEACDPDAMRAFLMDYDAASVLESQHLVAPLPEQVGAMRNDAIRELSRCGYYPNRLDVLRDEVDGEFRHMGTSYDEQLSAMVDNLVMRYRGG